ncbi:MAG: T9SS type A sorting domain-containing protein [Saprospiraceae bacterium]|nr:T9SS type A sorting domain-containing protein [Saprospiraceae bacterium]
MLTRYLSVLLLVGVAIKLPAQEISFTDLSLKSFLISEFCVDTNADGIYDATADFNADNQIQVEEAEAIIDLQLDIFPDTYFIHSVADLSHFSNLESLTILHQNSLTSLSELGLEKLESIWLGSNNELKYIDLSDLPNITNLRIEDTEGITYLNIQNGSFPSENFSLFYSDNIQFACIDSIAAEYEAVKWHMASGLTPTVTCGTSHTKSFNSDAALSVFPNPTNGWISVQTEVNIEWIKVYDVQGKLRLTFLQPDNVFDLTELRSGIYFIQFGSDTWIKTKKIVISKRTN